MRASLSITVSALLLALPAAHAFPRGGAYRASDTPATMRATALRYYAWRDSAYPVALSDKGRHSRDSLLTDYSMSAVRGRRARVASLLATVRAMDTRGWSKDDRVDWLLFRSQLVGDDFFSRERRTEESDPQLYGSEIANGIFSLLKKDYAPHRTRALAATARKNDVIITVGAGDVTLTAHELLAMLSAR